MSDPGRDSTRRSLGVPSSWSARSTAGSAQSTSSGALDDIEQVFGASIHEITDLLRGDEYPP